MRQLRRIQHPFTAIGNLYFREDIYASNGAAHVVLMEDEKYVPGPIATPHMFIGGRKLRVPRDLGPHDDAEHIATFTIIDSPGIIEALDEPHRSLDHSSRLAPGISRYPIATSPRPTCRRTISRVSSTGSAAVHGPFGMTLPMFLLGPEIRKGSGGANEFRVERWGNWEKMKLRPAFDRALGGERYGNPM